jgi:hypothetical protein
MLRTVDSQTSSSTMESGPSSTPPAPSSIRSALSASSSLESNATCPSLQGKRVSLISEILPCFSRLVIEKIKTDLAAGSMNDAMKSWFTLTQTVHLQDQDQKQVLITTLRKIFSCCAVGVVNTLVHSPRLTPEDKILIPQLVEYFRTLDPSLPSATQANTTDTENQPSPASGDYFLQLSLCSFCRCLAEDRWEDACSKLLFLNQSLPAENGDWIQKRTDLVSLLFFHWLTRTLQSPSCISRFNPRDCNTATRIAIEFQTIFSQLLFQQLVSQITGVATATAPLYTPSTTVSVSSSQNSPSFSSPPATARSASSTSPPADPLAFMLPLTPTTSFGLDTGEPECAGHSLDSPAAKKIRTPNDEDDEENTPLAFPSLFARLGQHYREPESNGSRKRKRFPGETE